jgi:DNA-binding response OmpR family regulator
MTKRECEALGATAFFEKPFDPEAVAAAVGAQLQRAADIEAETSP